MNNGQGNAKKKKKKNIHIGVERWLVLAAKQLLPVDGLEERMVFDFQGILTSAAQPLLGIALQQLGDETASRLGDVGRESQLVVEDTIVHFVNVPGVVRGLGTHEKCKRKTQKIKIK